MSMQMGTLLLEGITFSRPSDMSKSANSTFFQLCQYFCNSIQSDEHYSAVGALRLLKDGLEEGGAKLTITLSPDEHGVLNAFSLSAQEAAEAAKVLCTAAPHVKSINKISFGDTMPMVAQA